MDEPKHMTQNLKISHNEGEAFLKLLTDLFSDGESTSLVHMSSTPLASLVIKKWITRY